MTTLNPLGDKPFWCNVYSDGVEQFFGALFAAPKIDNAALYRLKVTPWIPHDGGPCPVGPDVVVRVRTRDGWFDSEKIRAAWWAREDGEDCLDCWKHEGNSENHIIAYQIVE